MPDQSTFFKYDTVEFTRGIVLGINAKPFPHFLSVAVPSKEFRPDIRVEDPADLSLVIEDGSVDAVFADCHESIALGVKDWYRCVKNGGYLVLRIETQPLELISTMRELGGWDLVVRRELDDSFVMVFKKSETGAHTHSWMANANQRKTACVVRYGGFGDMIQAANIFPALIAQGYRVTVMTTPKGKEIIENDPHVSDWYIQDHDQVPNQELGEFWKVVSQRFDKFVNLCESVEGTLLAMPGRANYMWPHELRHERLNDNYLEFTAKLAGVPYSSKSRFYPTADETSRANAAILHGGFNVMFALAGSSCHKYYPGMDAVIANILLDHQNCRIFMVGNDDCKLLEQGWEKESRVVMLSGELGIRDTLALAQKCDVVIGCETGVLNAVAFDSNRKVVLLSHSSPNNLTKHWVNTASLAPQGLHCYPCHRLHYTREFCMEDKETGAAMCQRMINPADVYAAAIAVEEAAA